MQFVEHHALERAEHVRRVGAREQERELLRCCKEDVRRIPALALALGCGRVAGTRFETDIQAHLAHRNLQVASDIDGECRQWRYVQGVESPRAHQRATRRLQGPRPYIALAEFNE